MYHGRPHDIVVERGEKVMVMLPRIETKKWDIVQEAARLFVERFQLLI
ncbi:MAG: hypothetical protein ACRBM6_16820 [Geminicoccales bacterium]